MSSILVPGVVDADRPPRVRHDGTGPMCTCGSNGTAPAPCAVHRAVTPTEALAMWRRAGERPR